MDAHRPPTWRIGRIPSVSSPAVCLVFIVYSTLLHPPKTDRLESAHILFRLRKHSFLYIPY